MSISSRLISLMKSSMASRMTSRLTSLMKSSMGLRIALRRRLQMASCLTSRTTHTIAAVLLLLVAPFLHLHAQSMRLIAPAVPGQHSAEAQENSREAGLFTDWHLLKRYGRRPSDFARHFAPERDAANFASAPVEVTSPRSYELVFDDGSFALTPAQARFKGVYYAESKTYLASSGDWNVYLESGAQALVFVDGAPVVERGSSANGVLRGTIHVSSGYHMVMVKFLAQAAPFRVAILPPSSGSRRKNNTPYLQASPASEDLMAAILPKN
jgi:hypothetical protein